MRTRIPPGRPVTSAFALALSFCLTVVPPSSAGDQPFRVRLTDIAIPAGASLGEVRRTIQPFPNWTLICDENLKARTKVCNVTQSFVDAAGATAFSWSLAATEGGKPLFILRAPASVGPDGTISVKPASGKPLAAAVQACDAAICIATLPFGRALGDEITRGEPVTISYDAGRPVALSAPLNGLAKAIAAID
jgi:invasion protein IalB